MKQKYILPIGVAIILIVALFFSSQVAKPKVTYWPGTDVACLPSGHENLALHIHPLLTITIDGEKMPVAGGIGVSQTCMAETHTHESGEEIHLESTVAGRTFTLSDFFAVAGQELEPEGFTVVARVNGSEVSDIKTYELKDLDRIELEYTTIGE